MSTSLSVKIPSQDIWNAFTYFWNLLGLSTRVTGICECIEENKIYINCNVTTHETSENLTIIQKSIEMVGYADVYGVNHTPTDCWRLYPQQSIIYVKVPDKLVTLEKTEETVDTKSVDLVTELPKTEPSKEPSKTEPEPIIFTFKPPTFTFGQPSDSFKPFGQPSFKPFGLKEPNHKFAKIEPIGRIEQMAKESTLWLNQESERY
jgi:hypothetical protein